MTKITRKYLPIAVLFVVITVMAVLFFPREDFVFSFSDVLTLTVRGQRNETVKLWEDGKGTVYAFLPSYAAPESVVFQCSDRVLLDGAEISDGQAAPSADGVSHSLEMSGGEVKTAGLVVMQSENVAAMYVDTFYGTMDAVIENNGHSELVRITVFNPDGTINYDGGGGDTIKGRGNSTWALDKKPYSITLENSAGLLGMDAGRTWVLLANGYDETNMRNKLALDLAREVLPQWSPDSVYVDLYLNGEYAGLYLLCEKVEVEGERVFPSGHDGVLLELTNTDNFDYVEETKIFTGSGRAIAVKYPKSCDSGLLAELTQSVQRLEDAIVNESGTLASLIDPELLARRMLLDEVLVNVDADYKSSYYLYDLKGKTFCPGPAWDFDLILGNYSAYTCRFPYQIFSADKPWYGKLYGNKDFYVRLPSVYKSDFLPELEHMRDAALPALKQLLGAAGAMNSVRWDDMFKHSYFIMDEEPEVRIFKLEDFLARRIEYLNRLWIGNEDLKSVYLKNSSEYYYDILCVRSGERLSAQAILDAVGGDESISWFNETAGEPFDIKKPIKENTVLRAMISAAEVGNSSDETDSRLSCGLRQVKEFVVQRWFLVTSGVTIGIVGIITVLLFWKDAKNTWRRKK